MFLLSVYVFSSTFCPRCLFWWPNFVWFVPRILATDFCKSFSFLIFEATRRVFEVFVFLLRLKQTSD